MFPLIAVGATSGAACGSWITEILVKSGLFGTEWLLMVAIIPLTASIVLYRMVDSRMYQPDNLKLNHRRRLLLDLEDSGSSAFSIIFSSRFLLATAVITLILSWVNTNGENLLFRVVQEFLNETGTAGEYFGFR